jgi:GNAT superfamily N-acetyltransferase
MRIEFGMTIPMDLDEVDQFIVHYWGQILDSANPEDAGEESADIIVGRIEASRVYVALAVEHDENVADVFDSHSDEMLDFFEALFEADTDDLKEGISEQTSGPDVLLVESIEILPQYRGKGLGLKALRRTMEFLGGGCAATAIKALPVRYYASSEDDWGKRMQPDRFEPDRDQAAAKLRDYWAQLGFGLVEGSNVMTLDMAYEIRALPERAE